MKNSGQKDKAKNINISHSEVGDVYVHTQSTIFETWQ